MKLYGICKIDTSVAQQCLKLLSDACKKMGVEFILINPEEYDFSTPSPLSAGDAVYRFASGPLSQAVERGLLRQDSKSFYRDIRRAHQSYDDIFFHATEGVPSPKTIPAVTTNYPLLKKYAEYLGGYPLVLKILGKKMGAGVIKIESLDALSSVVRLAITDDKARVVLKEFISSTYSVRVIVIGGAAVGSITYQSPRGDFRSNVEKHPLMKAFTLSDEQAAIAIRAVKSLDLEFGGVDLLVNDQGEIFVAEVNYPCNFSDVQNTTGDDIASKMLEYLAQK